MSIGNAYTPTDRVVDANGQSILGADGRPDVAQVIQVERRKNTLRTGTSPNQVAFLDDVYSVPTNCASVIHRVYTQVGTAAPIFSYGEVVAPIYANVAALTADVNLQDNTNVPIGTRARTADGKQCIKYQGTTPWWQSVGAQT